MGVCAKAEVGEKQRKKDDSLRLEEQGVYRCRFCLNGWWCVLACVCHLFLHLLIPLHDVLGDLTTLGKRSNLGRWFSCNVLISGCLPKVGSALPSDAV